MPLGAPAPCRTQGKKSTHGQLEFCAMVKSIDLASGAYGYVVLCPRPQAQFTGVSLSNQLESPFWINASDFTLGTVYNAIPDSYNSTTLQQVFVHMSHTKGLMGVVRASKERFNPRTGPIGTYFCLKDANDAIQLSGQDVQNTGR